MSEQEIQTKRAIRRRNEIEQHTAECLQILNLVGDSLPAATTDYQLKLASAIMVSLASADVAAALSDLHTKLQDIDVTLTHMHGDR